MTTSVTIARSIPLNRNALLPLLRAQLATLEEASEHGTVVLGARIFGNGRIAVPVRLHIGYPHPKTPRFGVTITARATPALYPRFRGELVLTEAGTAATIVTLAGEYEVPLGVLGSAFDRIAGHGVAPRGLEDLLERLAADVLAEAGRHADAAYRAGRRSN